MEYIVKLWNPLVQVSQPFDDTDIHHGFRTILNLPTNMESRQYYALHISTIVSILIIAGIAGGILAISKNKWKF